MGTKLVIHVYAHNCIGVMCPFSGWFTVSLTTYVMSASSLTATIEVHQTYFLCAVGNWKRDYNLDPQHGLLVVSGWCWGIEERTCESIALALVHSLLLCSDLQAAAVIPPKEGGGGGGGDFSFLYSKGSVFNRIFCVFVF